MLKGAFSRGTGVTSSHVCEIFPMVRNNFMFFPSLLTTGRFCEVEPPHLLNALLPPLFLMATARLILQRFSLPHSLSVSLNTI